MAANEHAQENVEIEWSALEAKSSRIQKDRWTADHRMRSRPEESENEVSRKKRVRRRRAELCCAQLAVLDSK